VPFTLESLRHVGEMVKVWAEVIAYGSAGVFLIYKALSGYFITDLSLKITCKRFVSADADSLSVTATLKKGDKGTIRIHDARVRLTDAADGTVLDEKTMAGTNRLSFNTDASERITATFNRDSKTPWLSLPPGDETQFAAYFDVPYGTPCLLEVVILGKKLWGGKAAQWRASAVSFPKSDSTAR
jgi:hypothetical protein